MDGHVPDDPHIRLSSVHRHSGCHVPRRVVRLGDKHQRITSSSTRVSSELYSFAILEGMYGEIVVSYAPVLCG